MPTSRLIPGMRFGWSAVSSVSLTTGKATGRILSADANVYLEDDMKIRVSVHRDPLSIWLRMFYTGKDVLLTEALL